MYGFIVNFKWVPNLKFFDVFDVKCATLCVTKTKLKMQKNDDVTKDVHQHAIIRERKRPSKQESKNNRICGIYTRKLL